MTDKNSLTEQKLDILIVEDSPVQATMLRYLLEQHGYQVTVATNGQEALDRLAEHEFELVISDITMPIMSGLELLEEARQMYSKTAFIMLTGVDSQETGLKALELGAYVYIIKPFQANALMINVANALQRRALEKLRDDYETQLEHEVHERTNEIRTTQEEIMFRLVTASEYRDSETGTHIKRIGHYAALLAKSLGWDAIAVDDMKLAAPMHDVGKIGVPDSILLKPGRLTKKEFALMKRHTVIGAEMLKGSNIPVLGMAYDIALSHHEKFDGSGYPVGISGTDIPQSARIVAVCDVYDALSNDRVYHPAMPEDQVMGIMTAGRGQHFDPEIFDHFLQLLPEFRRIRQSSFDNKLEYDI